MRLLIGCLPAAAALAAGMVLSSPADAHAQDRPSAEVTTSSFAGSLDNPGPMTGTVSVTGASPGATYTVVTAFQALSEEDADGVSRFYTGDYVIAISCSTGVGSNTTEKLGLGGRYPGGPPPANTGTPLIRTDAGGKADCDYTVSFSGSTPSGNTTAIRSDIWLSLKGTQLAQAAGPSIVPPPTAIPEAPLPILLPATGLLVLGLLALHRPGRGGRERHAEQSG
jgi:hypothetical protein